MEQLYDYRRILVGLDLSEHDESLIEYVSKISKLIDIDAIYFVHVVKSLELSENITKKYPQLLAPVDESIKQTIQYSLDKFGDFDSNIKREIVIKEGDTSKMFLKTIQEKSIDLAVLGRKSDKEANLRIIKKIVRTAPCSISIIPEYLPEKLNKVLVPVDFSENSVMALRRATYFAKKFPDMEILTLHGFEVPTGYSKVGKSFDEFSEIMKENAKDELNHFLAHHELKLPNHSAHFHRCKSSHLPSAIYQFAAANNADAIIIGSRGRDSLSSFILGSVTEGLIEHDQYVPLIIIKSKTDYLGVLDSLKAL